MNIKMWRLSAVIFSILFKKCLKCYTFWVFLRINFASLSLLPLGQSQVCISFCNSLKLWACVSVTNSTTTDELSLPVIFPHFRTALFGSGSVCRSHIITSSRLLYLKINYHVSASFYFREWHWLRKALLFQLSFTSTFDMSGQSLSVECSVRRSHKWMS